MRKSNLVVMAVALVAVAIAGCASSAPGTGGTAAPGEGKSVIVEIREFAFEPSTVEVSVGGAVTWKSADTADHIVKGSGWESGPLARGDSFTNTFDTAGTFPYSCGNHPSMTGEVVVK